MVSESLLYFDLSARCPPAIRAANKVLEHFLGHSTRAMLMVFKTEQGDLVYANAATVPSGMLLLQWEPLLCSAEELAAVSETMAAETGELLEAMEGEVKRVSTGGS